jgi:hypothetical protein
MSYFRASSGLKGGQPCFVIYSPSFSILVSIEDPSLFHSLLSRQLSFRYVPATKSRSIPFPKLLSLAASSLFLATTVFAGDQCYYLDGQPAVGVYRCDNTTSGESSCCNAGQICYSNGVCQVGPENHATDWPRVGCTDPTCHPQLA